MKKVVACDEKSSMVTGAGVPVFQRSNTARCYQRSRDREITGLPIDHQLGHLQHGYRGAGGP